MVPRAISAAFNLATVSVFLFGGLADAGKPPSATVSVSAPSPAAGTVTATAKGTAAKLRRLEVYLDGSLKTTCMTSPCSYPWKTPASANGTHTLVAKRYDTNGTVTTSTPLTVVVNNDVTAPVVTVTAPAVASGIATLAALATDASGVTTTQLYVDGALVTSSAGGTASYTWNTTTATNGAHSVQAKATDPSGNIGSSALLSVSVDNGGGSPSATLLGDSTIYPEPFPAPSLPAAGGSYVDPTFGTMIIRLTDPSNAPHGGSVNSAPSDSMFNADGSMFYVCYSSVAWMLYGTNRSTGTVRPLGSLLTSVGYDGARWDPTNPSVLYGIRIDPTQRILYAITLPAGTATALHDFSAEIPMGGYPSSRVQVSPDSRYFAVTASTFGGQDQFDYVVVWDRQTNTSTVLNVKTRFNTYLHSMEMDGSGQYLRLGSADAAIGSIFWDWRANTFSTPVTLPAPDYFGGHKVFGAGVILNLGVYGDQWLTRSMATPHVFTELLTYPRKDGKVNWFEDSHASRILDDDSFVDSRYIPSGGWGTFTPYAGAIYQLAGFLQISADFAAPEVVRYLGHDLQQVSGIPSAPGRWGYNQSTDTLYVWLPDSSNPAANRAALQVLDWRPLMEEVVHVRPDGLNGWTWRRLAHHRSHYTGWGTDPRANADPTGSFVLFQSNWDNTLQNPDGSPRSDVFLIFVP
jgi:Big-like domain-containing protein